MFQLPTAASVRTLADKLVLPTDLMGHHFGVRLNEYLTHSEKVARSFTFKKPETSEQEMNRTDLLCATNCKPLRHRTDTVRESGEEFHP